MSDIKRSAQAIAGDLTVNSGDVIISDPSKGIIMEDQLGDQSRIKVIDDGGTKTIAVEELP